MTETKNPHLPGLPPVPLLGGRLDLIRLFMNPINIMQRIYRECGPIGAITRGDPSLVCAFGPQYNQQLLTNTKQYKNLAEMPIKAPEGSSFARFNQNLTTMEGDRHRQQRRLMSPAFHKKVVEAYRDSMVDVAEAHLSQWPQQGTLDMAHEMVELTLAVMMRCLFGLESGEYATKFGRMSTELAPRAISLGVMAFPVDLPFTPYGRFLRFCDKLEQEYLSIIRERRAKANQGQDVLSVLIDTHDDEGNSLSDEELIGQTGLLSFAGHETSAFTLVWTLFLLTQHPEICADLYAELDAQLGGQAPSIEQLAKLPLLDAVIKESMRLIPSVPLLFVRQGVERFQLGPYEMPAGSKVVLSPFITHRLPDIYDSPDRFMPERWQHITPSPYEYLPFGVGPRKCLGAAFASLELRLILALVLQRFRLQVVPHTRIDFQPRGIVLGVKGAVPMRIKAQDRDWQPPVPVRGTVRQLVRL